MKGKPNLTFVLLDLLDLLEDFFFLSTRPNYAALSRYWGYTEERAAYRAFERWQSQKYLEKVRQGERVLYRLGAKGREILAERRPSVAHRRRSWDGKWRMVVFDFPEVARKARDAFRWRLRSERMGCLQKSVWLTPDPVIPAWRTLLQETELTEWVLLFESAEMGPVDDREIARKVWFLDKLNARYQRYLTEFSDLPRRLRSVGEGAIPVELGRSVRRASRTYFDLLRDDPLLPVNLLASDFAGLKADKLHEQIRADLRASLSGIVK